MILWDCYTRTYPVAQKEHRCFWCHKTIHPDQEYRRTTGILEGRPHTQKWCKRCRPASNPEPGAWLRPEDALCDVLEEKGYCGEMEFDGCTLKMHGQQPRPLLGCDPKLYQCHLVPGVGLTEWVVVASGRDSDI